jgi:heavy metal sensor kinase
MARARWPSSLRSRLTLWYTILLGVPLIAFAVVCYVVFAHALRGRTDRFIGDALSAFSREVIAERRSGLAPSETLRTTVAEVHFRDLYIAILDSSRRVVATTGLAAEVAGDRRPSSEVETWVVDALRTIDDREPQAVTLSSALGEYRVVARPLVFAGERFRLTGTYSLSDINGVLSRIRRMFLVAIPLILIFAATGGSFLAKRSLAPVSSMAARAAEISATNLHERLPVGGGDELVGLARVVNDLLDRLEQSFEQQRRFMADASHELRTPTAILRTEADVTLSREHRSEDDYRASVAIMRDTARRLARIVDDLFLLARADSGNLAPRREPLYLEELVHDATQSVRQVAEQRGVQVALARMVEAPFEGDADLLGRILLNLLDNAIKHSPEGGTVEASMEHRNGHYEISIVDGGPGVPPEARERIFERFFRADTSRAGTMESVKSGAGLGLAIARRIAEMHDGRVDLVDSRPGRTEFRLTLKANGDGTTN